MKRAAVVLVAVALALVLAADVSAGRRRRPGFGPPGATTPTPVRVEDPNLVRVPGGIVIGVYVDPASPLFGDPVTARADIYVNPKRVDPESVKLDVDFRPYRPAGPPVLTRVEERGVVLFQYRWRLLCLRRPCAPPIGRSRTFRFDPAVLTFHRAPVPNPGRLFGVWYPITVSSRMTPDLALRADWQARENPPPPVSWGTAPRRLSSALFGAAAVVALLGLALVARALLPAVRARLGRRRRALALERELALVRDAAARGAEGDQRKALDGLAVALSGNGNDDLARGAKRLAWAEPGPTPAAALELADEVEQRFGGVAS
jgi:hypothetical protein